MRHQLTIVLALVMACGAVLDSSRAVAGLQDPQAVAATETTVFEMKRDLRAFADGTWFRRLLEENSDRPTARMISVVREEVRRGLDRHHETFRKLPTARQQEFLGELVSLMESYRQIPRGSSRIPARVLASLESWRTGYRAHLVANHTRALQSRAETLLRYLETLRLLPGGENLIDGTLQEGCQRYAYERYGSTEDEAAADAQAILLHEFQRFEEAFEKLNLEQQFDVWSRWRLGLRSVSMEGQPPGEGNSRQSPESALRQWTLRRARTTEEAMRQGLLASRERLVQEEPDLTSATPRLKSILERCSPSAIAEEARRWRCHWWGDEIEAGPEERQYEITVRSVGERRRREATLRAQGLSESERKILRRQLLIWELDQPEEAE